LAWAEVYATAKPQDRAGSCPFMANQTQFVVTQDGTATRISVHWADLDVARVQDIVEPVAVKAGQVVNFSWIEPVWLVPGMRDVPLPPVTVGRSVQLAPPRGDLAAKA
jgi:hypothetical protein